MDKSPDFEKAVDTKPLLKEKTIHRQWINQFRTDQNLTYFNLVLDYILKFIMPSKTSTFLDIGCGSGTKSILLANRGFKVHSIDFSDSALNFAKKNIQLEKYKKLIKLFKEDVTALRFDENYYENILCWGVLMHIIEYDKAIHEIYRVLKPGGFLIISESNMNSFTRIIIKPIIKLFYNFENEFYKKEGIVRYVKKADGSLLSRVTNIQYLIEKFEKEGLVHCKTVSGQFTEFYSITESKTLKKVIHFLNNIWFKYIKYSKLSESNILIFKKP
jgi:ubiquinone/menaquinone biosynthesis C-methylase UbiE